jgi:hypothetical protein
MLTGVAGMAGLAIGAAPAFGAEQSMVAKGMTKDMMNEGIMSKIAPGKSTLRTTTPAQGYSVAVVTHEVDDFNKWHSFVDDLFLERSADGAKRLKRDTPFTPEMGVVRQVFGRGTSASGKEQVIAMTVFKNSGFGPTKEFYDQRKDAKNAAFWQDMKDNRLIAGKFHQNYFSPEIFHGELPAGVPGPLAKGAGIVYSVSKLAPRASAFDEFKNFFVDQDEFHEGAGVVASAVGPMDRAELSASTDVGSGMGAGLGVVHFFKSGNDARRFGDRLKPKLEAMRSEPGFAVAADTTKVEGFTGMKHAVSFLKDKY